MPDSSQDFRNKVLGRQAEKLTCTFLKRRGYAIVERNFVTPYGEADIIAKSGDGTYCFVEVKARTGNPLITPAAAVTPQKQARYRRIAAYFCAMRREEVPVRFDVASILNGELEYIEDAFV